MFTSASCVQLKGGSPILWIWRKNDINSTQKQLRRLQNSPLAGQRTEKWTKVNNRLTILSEQVQTLFDDGKDDL